MVIFLLAFCNQGLVLFPILRRLRSNPWTAPESFGKVFFPVEITIFLLAFCYQGLVLFPIPTAEKQSMDNTGKKTCPSVKNILLLDSEGKRVAVKYYADDWPTHAAKLAFEKSVFTKTQKINARTEAEIAMFDGYIVVYKFIQDLHFFVTGGDNENELILATVLQGFFDAVGLILRNNVDKRTALENLDLILLCLDEIVDGGIILETEANAIAGKTSSDGMDGLPYLKLLQRLENTWQDLSSNNVVHEVLMLLNQLIPSATQVNRNNELVLPKEKLIEDHPDFVHRFSADILPVLMEVVKSGANLSICYSCLSLMHNIMYYSSADILQDLLMHKNISSFLAGLLAQRDQHVLFSTLKVVDLLMRKLQCVFASSFIKEGVVYAIEEFLLHHNSQSQYSAQQLDQQANQIAVQVSSKCLCCTFDSPNTSSSERLACQLGKDAVPTLAKHIKSTYFTDESVNSEFGMSEFLKKLKNFCATINEHVNRPSSSNGWAQSEEHLSELLDQVMGEIRLEESMSTFEFVESGIVRSLVHYLSNGQYLSRNSSNDASANHCLTILKRIQSFAGISLSKAGQTGKDVLLSLVEKLQDALTSLENFPVIPTNFKPRNAYSDIPVVHAALHPCLKVRFVREESEWNLSDYTDIVSIDLCSSFDAIEEYLWPKIRTSMSGQPKELKGKDVTHISVFGGDCLDEKVPPELHPSTPNLPLTSDTAEVTYSQENQTSPKDTNVKLRETMTESNNTPSSSTGIIDGNSSSSLSNSVVKPKLIFSMSGKRLDQSITLYQAILQLQLSTDPNLCLSSKFWTEVYKVSFRSAAPSMLDLKLSCSEQQSSLFWRKCGYPWHKIPFIQSLVLADLPCKLDKSNPAYDILFMIKILEGLNRSSSYLLSYERCTSFAKGGIEDLDDLSVIFPSIPQTEFINRKLTDKLQQQLQDPLTSASGCMPSWCDQLMESCPFLFSFEARWKYFRLTTFGSKVNTNQIQALYNPGSGFATTRLSASGSSLRKKFKVNRSNILESAEKMMSSHAHSRSVYEVEYDEEVGTGLGPTMEFFTLVSHEFRKAGLGMWRDDGSFIDSQMTKLAIEPGFVVAPFGLFSRPWVVGSSASNDSQFSDVIKSFLFLELGIYDFQAFDPELGSTLLEFQAISYKKKFLESANRDSSECVFYRNSTIEDLCLDFTLPGYPDYELTPGAKSKMVNIENLEEYVQLVVDATIKDGISAQMQAFKAGFNEVFPIKALQIFTEDELDRILCGEQDTWTFFELVDHVKFDHGYTSSSPPAINLLETIQEFECDQRRAFLQFVTELQGFP
ncbi:hypothetical protein HPP92_018111 [Vanilla planifolia]|uniref:HECT domain-containing protein n=1 Tax=Vanilla planifolia TaxID=51239 RepID=A0A835Q9A7_VANPL|nr:hypothetical protein HPP92_018111 [Vanilla planifolia]